MAHPAAAPMTPAAALARHLEWLEYALAAARDEEGRRRDRLARATNKNRDKRTARLAEVSGEVTELAALVEGIRSLQAQAARASATAGSTRTRSAKPATAKPATAKPATAKPASGRKTGGARKTTTGSRRSTRAASSKPASASSATKPAAAATSASTNGTEPKVKKPATRRRPSTGRSGSSS
jgi:starch synthase